MVSLATSHIARKCNQLNHVALPISMPRFKGIIFIKIAPKLSYICKKMQNLRAMGAPPTDPRASGGWGLCPQVPKTAPPLQISGYAPEHG